MVQLYSLGTSPKAVFEWSWNLVLCESERLATSDIIWFRGSFYRSGVSEAYFITHGNERKIRPNCGFQAYEFSGQCRSAGICAIFFIAASESFNYCKRTNSLIVERMLTIRDELKAGRSLDWKNKKKDWPGRNTWYAKKFRAWTGWCIQNPASSQTQRRNDPQTKVVHN